MNSRFSLPTTVLALRLAVVLGAGLLALIAAGGGAPVAMAPAAEYIRRIFAIPIAGAIVGAAAWMVLFALERDGYHRMDWTAFRNYTGRNPFDTSAFRKN